MTQATLQRLLKYPHAAVFDKSPQQKLALRVRNPAGLVWAIDGNVLRLEVGQDADWNGEIEFNGAYDFGLTLRQYSLADKTIAELAAELRADGHEVAFESAELGRRSARILIAGGANQDDTNGDHLNGYTSLLWVMLGAYAGELDEAEYQSGQALRQMVLTQAEGEWLDLWATLYGVPRRPGESDASLQQRIPQEVFRLRVNGLAIEQAITDVAEQAVTVDEPWKRMFLLDESALSGSHHFQDGAYYTYHVIQPVGVEGTDWSRVYPVLERNKAAGIEIFSPRVHFPAREIIVQPPVEYRIERGRIDVMGSAIWSTNNQVLGVMRLSDNEITLNHPCNRHDWWVLSEADGLQLQQQIEPHRSIAMASIPLSDGSALGDENAILSRGAESVAFDPQPIPSDLMMLSNYGYTTSVELVEYISIDAKSSAVTLDPITFAKFQRFDGRVYASAEGYPLDEGDYRVAGMAITNEVGTLDLNYNGHAAHNGLYEYIGYRGY